MSAYQDDQSRTPVILPPSGRTPPGGRRNERVAALLGDLAACHADLTAWAESRPGEPPPAPVLSIQLHGATREEELAGLRRTAEHLGVEVRTDEDGTRTAERRFGPVIVDATCPPRIGIDFPPLPNMRDARLELDDKDKADTGASASAGATKSTGARRRPCR